MIQDLFPKVFYGKDLKNGWKKVHGKSLSVCQMKNLCNFISYGTILFVWVTHKTFELDKWIKQFFIVKHRATEQL